MIGLTARQLELLRFIRGYQIAKGGVSPTLKQCAAAVGLRNRGGAHAILKRLSERGAVRVQADRRLQIEIIEAPAIPSINGVPLYAVPRAATGSTKFSSHDLRGEHL